MKDLSPEEKHRILLEEHYRNEVRASLEQKKSKAQRIIDFSNSPFAIWLLSSVVLAGLTSLWSRLNERHSKAEMDAKTTREITSKFQIAAHSATHSVSQYLETISNPTLEANLTDKIMLNQDWDTSDLKAEIPHSDISLRLNALAAVDTYNDLLPAAAAAAPKTSDAAQSSLASFLNSVEILNNSYTNWNASSEHKSSSTFHSGLPPDLTDSIGTLHALLEPVARENLDPDSLLRVVVDCQPPVDRLLHSLQNDLRSMKELQQVNYAALRYAETRIYNDVRTNTEPKDYKDLVRNFVADYDRLQHQSDFDYVSLLSDLEGTEADLLKFCKSGSDSKELPTLSAEIDEFAARAKVFESATPLGL